MDILIEGKFKGGAVKQPWDSRNYIYDDLVASAGSLEIDWVKGYDIRNELGGGIELKNQGPSSSCVGQGWSYQVWIFQVLEMMEKYNMTLDELRVHHKEEVDEISPKSIYPFIVLNGGGAYIGTGAKRCSKVGSLFESIVPSHKKDGTTDEKFMIDKSWWNEEMEKLAKVFSGKDYHIIKAKSNIDLFAQAIILNHGVVGGVKGQNGKGWDTETPQPPDSLETPLWGHCLDWLALGQDEKGKYIATPNSWDESAWNKDYKWKKGDKPGAGWQKIYEEYFTKCDGEFMFDPWTFTDIKNDLFLINKDMLDLVKGDNEKVYAIGKNGKLFHIYNESCFEKGRDAGIWGNWVDIKDIPQTEINNMEKDNSISFII